MSSSTSGRGQGRRRALGAAAVVVTLLGAAACGSGSGSSGSGGGTINVGQITTISGGFPFGDAVKGTKSYFNMVNAAGGIDGKKIKFVYGDDKGQASESAQLARKFVLQNNVVAMIGNTSLADCDTNKGFYQSKKIAVIGTGVEPSCFSQPNWQPVNSGPYVGRVVEWEYLFNVIKPTSVCEISQNDPTSIDYYEQLRKWYQSKNPDAKFTSVTYTNDASQNPTPEVTAAKQKGCDAVILSTVAPNAVAFVKAAKSVGLDATFINLGSAYDESVPAALGALAEPGGLGPNSKGFFVGAELAKVDSPEPKVKEMVAQFKKDNTPSNFWSELGWVSAAEFVDALKNAKDGDTATSSGVLKILQGMEPYDSGFSADPLAFGTQSSHAPNTSAQMLTIKDEAWVIAENQNDGDYTKVSGLPKPAEK